MPPTTYAANLRMGVIAILMLAMLTAAVPVRADLGPFQETCPAELEATAQVDGSIRLDVEASTQTQLYRDGETIAQLNGTGTHFDADVGAGVTYTYHVTLLIHGAQSPPCAEATATVEADRTATGNATAHGNATGNATAQGNATGNATAQGNATAHGGNASVAAVLEACPASLEARTLADGSVVLHVNASAAVDAVTVYRQSAEGTRQIGTASGSGVIVDATAEAEVAYTYHVTVTVDGQESLPCDAVELSNMPVFQGIGAFLAVAIAAIAYIVRRGAA